MADEYYYLQNKRWRAIGYNWEILSSYGDTSRAYCLTDFQAAWLIANTEYMAWSSRWSNCPCTEQDLIDMQAELAYRLMDCIDIQPYQLQYLYNAGQTAELNALQSLWDSDPTPSNINSSTPDDYYDGDGSQERLDALCTACKIYVYSYAQNWVTKAQVVLGLIAVVGLVSSITLVGGMIAGVVFAGVALMTAITLDAMQDTSALDEIVCCMNESLKTLAITSANFETCLDGCSFDVGSNAEIARDIIASDLNQFSNWLSFINSLGDSYDYANIGITDCPCEGSWTHTFDFTIGDGDFLIYSPAGNANEFGVYDGGIGWDTTDSIWTSSPLQYRRAVAIELIWTPTTNLTEISMTYDFTKGTYSSTATAVALSMRNGSTNVQYASETSAVIVNGSDKVKTVTANAVANGIRFFVSSCARTSAVYNGEALIKSVTVKGTGYNPF